MRDALSAESLPGTPPGIRSRRSPWRRLRTRVRSETRSSRCSESSLRTSILSSGRTRAKRPLRQAASAAKVASSSSFLRPFPTESTLTRAESLGGTSTTSSPEEASLWARVLPRPLAPSTAHRRSGKRLAQCSNTRKPFRSAENSARSSSSPCSSMTATALVALCGSTPIKTFVSMDLPPSRLLATTPRGGHTDFGLEPSRALRERTSVEPLRHGGHRPGAGLIRASPTSERQVTTRAS